MDMIDDERNSSDISAYAIREHVHPEPPKGISPFFPWLHLVKSVSFEHFDEENDSLFAIFVALWNAQTVLDLRDAYRERR